MANSPCGGCPPCCDQCVFTPVAEQVPSNRDVVVPAAEYGCVKGFGDVIVADGQLGQMRGDDFHPVTDAGAEHLRTTGNPLAQFL